MPQWDFLDYLAREAAAYPGFHLMMSAEVREIIEEKGRIAGVRAAGANGTLELRASLVVGADGRNSIVREKAELEVQSFGTQSEVVWMKLSHQSADPPHVMGHGGPRQGFVMIDRGDYWQCGYVPQREQLRRDEGAGPRRLPRDGGGGLAAAAGAPAGSSLLGRCASA